MRHWAAPARASSTASWRPSRSASGPATRCKAAADRAGRARLPLAGDGMSRMAASTPNSSRTSEWLGFVQPVGPRRLAAGAGRRAGVPRTRTSSPTQRASSRSCVEGRRRTDEPVADRRRLRGSRSVLGWQPRDLVGEPADGRLARALDGRRCPSTTRRCGRPTPCANADATATALAAARPDASRPGTDLDDVAETDGTAGRPARRRASSGCCARRRSRSACSSNGTHLRLVYAPRGETSGPPHVPRRGDDARSPGRPIFAALLMLLLGERPALQRCPTSQRLPALLARAASTRTRSRPSSPSRCSRRSTSCSAASRRPTTQRRGELLARRARASDPNEVYGGLLTVLMRLVFLLYAEDRGLLPDDEVYQQHYSVHGPLRAAARGRRPLPRHDGPALRRLGAAPRPLPAGPRRRRPRRLCASRRATGCLFDPDATRSSKAARTASPRSRGERDRAAARPRRRRLPRAARTCSSSTASGSPTARSTSSRSARSTRR